MLSLYVDGELAEQEAREIEEQIASDPEAAKEIQELRAMKALLSSRQQMPETLGFWTRLAAKLDRQEREQENLLPFSRKYLPLVYAAGALAVILVGVLLFQERSAVISYVSRQSEKVQQAVEQNVLKGTLLPLFTNIDKNQALQFALFGSLPLDARAETALRIDESADQGYRIDVGKQAVEAIPKVTVTEFVDEIKPTRRQREVIDSVLDIGRRRIESSVLFAEDRGMAIDADLAQLNKVMLSGIAACLEPPQRVRFERFLEAKKAPYMIASTYALPEPGENIVHEMRRARRSSRMIVVTPETLLVSEMEFNLDSLQERFHEMTAARREMAMRFDGLIRRIAEQEAPWKKHVDMRTQPFWITGDSDMLTIQIGRVFEELPGVMHDRWIQPRVPVSVRAPRRPRDGSLRFNFNFDQRDSSFFFNLDLDSLVLRMQKEGPEAAFEFFLGDPGSRNRNLRLLEEMSPDELGSMLKAKRISRSRLDSVLRLMRERGLDERK
jgi:hypothetical protein